MDTQIAALSGVMIGVLAYLVVGVVLLGFPRSVLIIVAVGLVGGSLGVGYVHFTHNNSER